MAIKFTNNAFGTLAISILSTDVTINLTAGQGARFPALAAGDWFYADLIDASGNLELVKATARASDALTVSRGVDGTAARAYSAGDRFELRLCNAAMQDIINPITQPVTGGTVTANAPVFDATQTWNNAAVTFTGIRSNITDSASNAASLLADLQVAGASKFSVDKTGKIVALSATLAGTLALAGATVSGAPTWSSTQAMNISGSSASATGNAATATALQTGRTINGVTFDGTANITVAAAAGTLTGATLAAGVTASSLTSLGTLVSLAVTGAITTNGFTVGYLEAPFNQQDANYTLVLADSGKTIYHTSVTAHTHTIPANASVAYPVGAILTFVNDNAAGNVSIAITTDTLRFSPTGTTGTRTLAANGRATAVKMTATTWQIAGSNLT